MSARREDGSAGDANYGVIGVNYKRYRQPDAEIEKYLVEALGDARTVLNVGAGAGSYEPRGRIVAAVEPSAAMRSQRGPDRVLAVDAVAENLPFVNASFDASMATFSIHQWKDMEKGLSEMRRVTSGPVVLLTCDPDSLDRFWLNEYAPEAIAVEASRYPKLDRVAEALGGEIEIVSVPIPLQCTDGFSEAYYGRPEGLLDPGARLANSAWSFVAPEVGDRFVERLACDLGSGEWDRRYGHYRQQANFDGSLRLIISRPLSVMTAD
ncbi:MULTISPECIES: class I SAM-dependent methyltransferase [Rhizobium/Agrobacterium group]|uniref:class I SAM-dependent methyltransferase n=1 Tax=Rhizobium/Agrobacterium group TaxID=227290 RepID=UPI002300CED9|nr:MULTISPECIES: class I SAM-dependent methyltransferase [Rhizobium/Agrobacterium group]MDA5635929.1 class I SAM-dependent methyltransferase [Agrobacterium sp. ST15.16.024]MDF1891162.1 class I SAM-dependent methyltransferase [Rhizobium rhizogenes]